MWVSSERRDEAAKRRTRWKGRTRTRVLPAWVAVLTLFCAGSASAARIEFQDDPVLSDTATAKRLVLGSGYSLQITSFEYETGWNNQLGDRITFAGNVSFADADNIEAEFMLVFTSVRIGPVGAITCPDLSPGGAFVRGDFDYVRDGVNGPGVTRHLTPTDSEVFGKSQICNAEDGHTPIFGLVFAPTSSEPVEFSFQIAQTDLGLPDDDFANLKLLQQGYHAVPELDTAILLMGGLLGLAIRGRRAPRRR